jgi:glycosyltransferase involved in cell wall biosynthesis
MRILHTVELYQPSVGGMQEIVKQVSERLINLGHEVTVATTRLPERREQKINGVTVAEFSIAGSIVKGLLGDVKAYQDYLVNSHFDIITNFAAQQWATDVALPILDRIKTKKVLFPSGFSGLYLPEYEDFFASMKSWMKQYDMNVFNSDNYRDIEFARDCGVEKLVLIPNGAAADEFLPESDVNIRQQLGIPSNHFLILHVGSHTGIKGHVEAIEIFRRSRIRNATFLIVANHFGDGGCVEFCDRANLDFNKSLKRLLDNKKLIVTSLPRKETVAAYRAADLFLFPSNIECSPLVLFECMAAKTPFLTTDVGNAAEIIGWSGAGRLLPTIKDPSGYCKAEIDSSAEMLRDSYNQPIERAAMKTAGFEAWQERFTWERITKSYEALYVDLLKN